jgi:hypothetical protein
MDAPNTYRIIEYNCYSTYIIFLSLTTNDMYSVRSAYYQLMENIIDNNHLKENGNWKKLWKLQVPNKVKIFLWGVLRGCLPVRSRLVDKGVRCDNKCPQCASYAENE